MFPRQYLSLSLSLSLYLSIYLSICCTTWTLFNCKFSWRLIVSEISKVLTCLLLFYCVLVILWFIVELNYCCCDINEGRLVGKPELSLELASLAVKPVRYIWETETRCHPWNQLYTRSGVSGSRSQFRPTRTEVGNDNMLLSIWGFSKILSFQTMDWWAGWVKCLSLRCEAMLR